MGVVLTRISLGLFAFFLLLFCLEQCFRECLFALNQFVINLVTRYFKYSIHARLICKSYEPESSRLAVSVDYQDAVYDCAELAEVLCHLLFSCR